MQHEWIGIAAQLGDDERHALGHQAGNERDVTGKPIEFGHQDGAFGRSGSRQRGCQLRPAVQGIGALTGLCLDELGNDRETLGLGEASNGRPLVDAPPGAVLLL
jgi:hypothetical protein